MGSHVPWASVVDTLVGATPVPPFLRPQLATLWVAEHRGMGKGMCGVHHLIFAALEKIFHCFFSFFFNFHCVLRHGLFGITVSPQSIPQNSRGEIIRSFIGSTADFGLEIAFEFVNMP